MPDASRSTDAWLGCRVGAHHRIVKHLGSGGMGHVFLAEDLVGGAPAAVKLVPAEGTPAQALCLIEEGRLLSSQDHPNIVHALELGALEDETPYVLMEYVPGEALSDWLESGQRLSLQRVSRILRQLACAIDHMHACGILHRDIKPANVMVDARAEDAVKLIDFGVAVREGSALAGLDGRVLGTPAYMAPEQAASQACTRATDRYALAALALELLTGKAPYDYPSSNMLFKAVLYEAPSLPSARGLCRPGLDALFERALARDPGARFESARAFVDALDAALGVPSGGLSLAPPRCAGRLAACACLRPALALACVALASMA